MPRRPLGEKAMTDAERQRKRRERLRKETPALSDRQKLARAQAEIARLREATATARPARVAPASSQELAEARQEIERLKANNRQLADEILEQGKRFGDELKRRTASPKLAKPAKPPKPPVDPDSEVARLRKSNSELRGRLRTMAGVYAEEIRNKGAMTFKTVSLISKALTDADALEALKAFNAWKADSKRAR
jgi:hypothetical protein